jgi:hypothetical protein
LQKNVLKDTSERRWAIHDNYWLPERSDHPLEGPPTSWGLLDRKRSQSQCIRRQRTTPEIRYTIFFFSSILIFHLVNIRIDMFLIDPKLIYPHDVLIFPEYIQLLLIVRIPSIKIRVLVPYLTSLVDPQSLLILWKSIIYVLIEEIRIFPELISILDHCQII